MQYVERDTESEQSRLLQERAESRGGLRCVQIVMDNRKETEWQAACPLLSCAMYADWLTQRHA